MDSTLRLSALLAWTNRWWLKQGRFHQWSLTLSNSWTPRCNRTRRQLNSPSRAHSTKMVLSTSWAPSAREDSGRTPICSARCKHSAHPLAQASLKISLEDRLSTAELATSHSHTLAWTSVRADNFCQAATPSATVISPPTWCSTGTSRAQTIR